MESKYYLRTTIVLRIWFQVEELDMEKLRSQNRIEMRNMAGDSAAAALAREQPVDAYEQVGRLNLSQSVYMPWLRRSRKVKLLEYFAFRAFDAPGCPLKTPCAHFHVHFMSGSFSLSSTTKEHLKKMATKTPPCPWKA